MKMLLFVLFSFFSFGKILVSPEEIHWQDSKRLTFDDFKGAAPRVTMWAATTSSKINFYYESLNGALSKVVVYASFNQDRSWIKKRVPEVLAHEQLHFDITEIFARKFYHEVIKKTSANKSELSALFQKENKECEELQRQYDEETDHGTIEDAQAKWKEKVNEMLQSEEPYPSQE